MTLSYFNLKVLYTNNLRLVLVRPHIRPTFWYDIPEGLQRISEANIKHGRQTKDKLAGRRHAAKVGRRVLGELKRLERQLEDAGLMPDDWGLGSWWRWSDSNIGPKQFQQNRTVSWLTSTPRSWRRSSTLRRENGKRTYIITASRMT